MEVKKERQGGEEWGGHIDTFCYKIVSNNKGVVKVAIKACVCYCSLVLCVWLIYQYQTTENIKYEAYGWSFYVVVFLLGIFLSNDLGSCH